MVYDVYIVGVTYDHGSSLIFMALNILKTHKPAVLFRLLNVFSPSKKSLAYVTNMRIARFEKEKT